MKTTSSRNHRGNVLLVTLGLLTIICAFTGIAFNVTSNTAKTISRSRDFAAANAAAEGALEYAYAIWTRRIGRGLFNTDDLAESLKAPEIEGIKFDGDGITLTALDAYGAKNPTGVAITGRVPGYQGWSGQTRNYAAEARVKMEDGTIVGVRRIFQYTEVPLFQSMFFFQNDLEFYLPATMMINGLVHTNSNMYSLSSGTNTLTFQGNVTYTGTFIYKGTDLSKRAPEAGPFWSALPKAADAREPVWAINDKAQLSQVPAIQPMGGKPEEVFNPNNTNKNDDGYHELVEPPFPGHDDPEAIASRRLYNKAGIVVEINTVKDGNKDVHQFTVKAQGDTSLPSSVTVGIQSALTKEIGKQKTDKKGNTPAVPGAGIWDAREQAWVDITTVDMSKIKTAVEGLTGFNNVIYIHDLTSGGNRKAIKLVDGRILPDNGLTIASENPVYIQGDYNTGENGTGFKGPPASDPDTKNGGNPKNLPERATVTGYERKPAAVIADAVMFLSNNWKDSNTHTGGFNLTNSIASNTTYNVAIIAGHKPSNVKAKYYSGGANNFPRFLENWNGKYCTYFGSMIELFDSKKFNGNWDTTNIYSPPLRCWNFDTKYLIKPPPGSVEAVVLNRGPWSRF